MWYICLQDRLSQHDCMNQHHHYSDCHDTVGFESIPSGPPRFFKFVHYLLQVIYT